MKKTITIGIPAYNEEANIRELILELKKQVIENFHLDTIIIVSDGSSDNTVRIAKELQDKRFTIIDEKRRLGLADTENMIIEQTNSDILILLNADISIKDIYFVEHMALRIAEGKADLVTPEFKQLFPATFFERILYRSAELKNAIYEEFQNGANIYTCAGPARAFSKRLYKKLRFKDSANEDAYSFLYTKVNGYHYNHIHDTAVYFRLPNNFSDHKKQSTRFFHSKRKLIKEFGDKNVENNYKIPFGIIITITKKYFLRHPLELGLYGCVLGYTWLSSLGKAKNVELWQSSTSSKVLKS